MKFQLFKHWKTKVAEFSQGRTPQSDEAFLADCGLPDDDVSRRVALGVRGAFAEYGSVDPNFIFATDRFPEDLGVLPSWDSIDQLAIIFELEKKLEIVIPIRNKNVLCPEKFTVREFIAALISVYRRAKEAG